MRIMKCLSLLTYKVVNDRTDLAHSFTQGRHLLTPFKLFGCCPDIIGMAIKSFFSNFFLTKYNLSEMTPETITVNPSAMVAIGN